MRGDIKVVRKSIPYQRLYDQLKKVKFWSTILTCVAFILTFTSAFKRFQFTQTAIFYIILIILYCGIITLRVVSLCTKAPKKRIGGLIDDAFGTKILEKGR